MGMKAKEGVEGKVGSKGGRSWTCVGRTKWLRGRGRGRRGKKVLDIGRREWLKKRSSGRKEGNKGSRDTRRTEWKEESKGRKEVSRICGQEGEVAGQPLGD